MSDDRPTCDIERYRTMAPPDAYARQYGGHPGPTSAGYVNRVTRPDLYALAEIRKAQSAGHALDVEKAKRLRAEAERATLVREIAEDHGVSLVSAARVAEVMVTAMQTLGMYLPPFPGVEHRLRREATANRAAKLELEQAKTRDRAAVALAHINRRRTRLGERLLDPAASEWTDDDVIAEAKRTGWDG